MVPAAIGFTCIVQVQINCGGMQRTTYIPQEDKYIKRGGSIPTFTHLPSIPTNQPVLTGYVDDILLYYHLIVKVGVTPKEQPDLPEIMAISEFLNLPGKSG